MSEQNVALVKVGYEAFARKDIAGVLELLADDVQMSDPFGFSDGAYVGHEGFVQTVREATDAFDDYEIRAEDYIDTGDDVIVAVQIVGVGRGSGIPVDRRLFHVWTLRDGKAVRGRTFYTRKEALEAAGS